MKTKSAGNRKKISEQMKQVIASLLDQHTFRHIPMKLKGVAAVERMKTASNEVLDGIECNGVFATNVLLCRDIIEDPYRVDFLIHAKTWQVPIAVIIYHQGGGGSNKEKLEHNFRTITDRFPCRCIVILSGAGFPEGLFRRGAWYFGESKGKVAKIMRELTGFAEWLTEGYPEPAIPSQPTMLS